MPAVPPIRPHAYPSPGTPIGNGQKARLCILARRAWERAGAPGDPDEWRRGQQAAACGKPSLRLATQNDYLLIRARFLDLLGESGAAFEDLVRQQSEGRRLAWNKLETACKERGLALAYPDAICRKEYKRGLEDADEKQLWRLVYTVRNRRKPLVGCDRRARRTLTKPDGPAVRPYPPAPAVSANCPF